MADYTYILADTTQAEIAKTVPGGFASTTYDTAQIVIEQGGSVSLRVYRHYDADGTPREVWAGLTRCYSIASNPSLDALHCELEEGGRAAALIDRIVAGLDEEWDDRNMIGTLTADAIKAESALVDLLINLDHSDLEVWDAEDWLFGDGTDTRTVLLRDLGLTLDSKPADVASAAVDLRDTAETEGVVLTGDALENLLAKALKDIQTKAEVEVDPV